MEKWRSASSGGWATTTYDPEPFVRELADVALEVLRDTAVHGQVSQIVRQTMQAEWDEHLQRDARCDKKLLSTLNGHKVVSLTRDERRQLLLAIGFGGDRYAKTGWPFPILHGIDAPPGCYLVLAGLNEIAVADPQGFDPRHTSVYTWANDGPSVCFLPYKAGWEGVCKTHVQILREVFDAAKADLKSRGLWAEAKVCASETQTYTKAKHQGRKIKYDSERDRKLADDWAAAKREGAYKPNFARQHGMSLKEFDSLLARVRNRKPRHRAK